MEKIIFQICFRDKVGGFVVKIYNFTNGTCVTFLGTYHHFSLNCKRPGTVIVKESVDGKKTSFNLLRDITFRFNTKKSHKLPAIITPKGMSAERSWYLYDNIRNHIPFENDKNTTCPLPNVKKPK